MKEDVLVSVVIPAFNAEKYIKNCVESILGQTYKHIEIIVVDDCSTDNTHSIVEKISQINSCVTIVNNKKNSGQTLSRNHGIKHINGEWFMMVDADDELPRNAIESLLELESDAPDVIIGEYETIGFDGKVSKHGANLKKGIYSTKEIAEFLFEEIPMEVLTCVGTKLYNTDFVKNRKIKTSDFPRTGGDCMFITDSLLSDAQVGYVDKVVYKYYMRSTSISHTYRENMYSDLMKTRAGIRRILKKYGLLKSKALSYAMLRYGIVFSSLAQECIKPRSYADFHDVWEMICSDKETETVRWIILNNGKESVGKKSRIFLRLWKFPRLIYLGMRLYG